MCDQPLWTALQTFPVSCDEFVPHANFRTCTTRNAVTKNDCWHFRHFVRLSMRSDRSNTRTCRTIADVPHPGVAVASEFPDGVGPGALHRRLVASSLHLHPTCGFDVRATNDCKENCHCCARLEINTRRFTSEINSRTNPDSEWRLNGLTKIETIEPGSRSVLTVKHTDQGEHHNTCN